jgi:hypothetical protein
VSKGFFRRAYNKLCINKLTFTMDGKVFLGGVKEVDLRYPFQQNSCISVSTVGDEIRVFIGHCTGKVEHYILDESTF